MHPLYDKFCKLCQELAIKGRIDPILSKLYVKRDELEVALENLNSAMQKEQADVEKIEGMTVSSIFYTVIGQKDKKLEKEKAEAAIAEEEYYALQNELADLNEEIKKYERELRTVRGCDLRYGRLLPQILDEIRASDTLEAKAVIDTFDSLTRIEEKLQKLDEALELCRDALKNAMDSAKYLAESEDYAKKLAHANNDTWITIRSKIRVILSEAQPIVDELCRQIKRLDADLVGSRIDFYIKIDLIFPFDDISEWKAATDRLTTQIKEIEGKLILARERWAKVADQRRTELHEQIKTVLQ